MANNTILLIDYEPRSIERFRDPLIAAGFSVEIATDGISGIEAFHRLNPDMVLVEAMIPKKHGFEVCQELKKTPHGRGTPVIITTGVYKGRKYRTQALHIYGCDEYIEKPIAPAQLLEIVGKFLTLDATAASAERAESAPLTPETGDRPSVRHNIDSVATPGTSARKDDGEDEITARLDALLSGIAGDSQLFTTPKKAAGVSAVALDPFAQMRAELDAELDSISTPLPFETAPKLEPLSEPLVSDQMVAPSVLEALSSRAATPNVASSPAPTPKVHAGEDAEAGELVNFETKRRRKGKKAEKQNAKRSPHIEPIAEVPRIEAVPEIAEVGRVADAEETAEVVDVVDIAEVVDVVDVAEVAQITRITQFGKAANAASEHRAATLPKGTMVESELNPTAAKRGMPIWAWAAVAAITLLGLYFVIPHGNSSPEPPAPSPAPETTTVTTEPPVTSPPAASTAPSQTLPREPEPSPAAPDSPKPILAAAKVPPPKKQSDSAAGPSAAPSTSSESAKPASAKPQPVTTKAQPVPAKAQPATVAPVTIVASAPSAPDAIAANVANVASNPGVETIPETAARPSATTVAPGALVPIDVADTMPVPISRKAPTYSAAARQLRLTGTVTMNVLVNDRGTVDRVVLVSGVPGADLNDAAIAAAKTWTYKPATKEGVPVKVWKSEHVDYKP